ncbi:MAG: hypothetical protein J5833_01440 [Victivallales bacterium]|nr:hypothetical protein [Victivallales bacterium]
MVKRIASALALSALAAFAQNLIRNPSFEELNNDGMPKEWSVLNPKKIADSHTVMKDNARDEKTSVKLANVNPDDPEAQLIWQQYVSQVKFAECKPGTQLELSVFAYAADKPAKARIYLESIKANKTHLTERTLPANKWEKLSIRFAKADVEYTSPYVCLQLLGKGSVIFDCAYLGPVGENKWTSVSFNNGNFVINGSAEEPLEGTGWGVINRTTNGAKVFRDEQRSKTGSYSFRLESAEKPDGMVAWIYHLPVETFDIIAPETEVAILYDANNQSNPGTKFRCYAEFQQDARYVGNSISPETSVYAGWGEQVFKFRMPAEKPNKGYIVLQLMTEGYVNFDNVRFVLADTLPKSEAVLSANDYCRFLNPPRNSNFIMPNVPSELTLECHVPDSKLHVELAVIDGETVGKWDFEDLPIRETTTIKITLPKLAPEAYELKYTSGKLEDYDWFRVSKKDNLRVKFDDNDILLVDGKHFFPIGICTPSRDLDSMRVYGKSGINVINCTCSSNDQVTEYFLPALKKFGLMGMEWNNWGWMQNTPEDDIRALYQKVNKNLKKQDRMICFLSDEAMWGGVKVDSMRKFFRLMFKYCPDYPAWLNHAPRLTGSPDQPNQSFDNGRRFARSGNLTGADIYPIPEGHGHNNLKNRTMSCVGEYTDMCRQLTWDTKPVWMIIQAFGWSEEGGKLDEKNPRPTEKQLRFMIWNAITHGARGIVWYGAGCKDVYSEWWTIFAKVNLELKAITDLMVLSPIEDIKGLPEGVRGIRGKGYAVYVNENKAEAVADGRTLEPQGVLFVTDKPLNVVAPPRFKKEEQSLGKKLDYEIRPFDVEGDWVAHPEHTNTPHVTVYSKQSFTLDNPKDVVLYMSADDQAKLTINGRKLEVKIGGHRRVSILDITKFTKAGENTISVALTNMTGPTGMRYEIKAGGKTVATTGDDTLFSKDGNTGWVKPHNIGKVYAPSWYSETDVLYIRNVK